LDKINVLDGTASELHEKSGFSVNIFGQLNESISSPVKYFLQTLYILA